MYYNMGMLSYYTSKRWFQSLKEGNFNVEVESHSRRTLLIYSAIWNQLIEDVVIIGQ